MFYLKEFFKSIGEAPIRGMSFLLFSCLLAMGLTHRSWVAGTISLVSPEKMVNPYFVAVIDGEVDGEKMRDYLSRLPGVVSIDDKESEKSRSKIISLVKDLGADYSVGSDLLDFKSYKVTMNPALSIESLSFIRSQAVKQGGKEHVSATEIKYPEVTSSMKTHPFYVFLGKSGDWGFLALVAVCWSISFALCYNVFRSRAYIIEKFQRKKFVAAKSVAWGLSAVFISFTCLGIWNGTLKVFDLVILFMVFSIFWTFLMQEWRWKPTL